MKFSYLGLALALAQPVAAQNAGTQIGNGFRDIWYIWSSPARIDSEGARNLGLVAAGTGVMMLVDEPVYRWIEAHRDSPVLWPFKPFQQGSPLSLLGRTGVLAGAGLVMFGLGHAFDSPDWQQAGIGCASSAVSATAARGVFNRIVGRSRPLAQKGAFEFRLLGNLWNDRSMPGGHAAHIMSCVSYWNDRFDLGAAEPVLYGVATAVGWARVVDGAHWPSDTFLGQAYGFAIGKGIAGRYADRDAADDSPAPSIGFQFSIRF